MILEGNNKLESAVPSRVIVSTRLWLLLSTCGLKIYPQLGRLSTDLGGSLGFQEPFNIINDTHFPLGRAAAVVSPYRNSTTRYSL